MFRLLIFIIVLLLVGCKEKQKELPSPSPSASVSGRLASQVEASKPPPFAQKQELPPKKEKLVKAPWNVPKPKFKFTPREKWSAMDAKEGMERVLYNEEKWIAGFVLMHTGGGIIIDAESEEQRLRGAQAYHINHKKWHDIGYHWAIGPSGTIYEGRSEQFRIESSYTFTDKFASRDFIAIVLLGDFNKEKSDKEPDTTTTTPALDAGNADLEGGTAGAPVSQPKTKEDPEYQELTDLQYDALVQVLCDRTRAFKLTCKDTRLALEVSNAGGNPGSYFAKWWQGNLAVGEGDLPIYGGDSEFCTALATNKY